MDARQSPPLVNWTYGATRASLCRVHNAGCPCMLLFRPVRFVSLDWLARIFCSLEDRTSKKTLSLINFPTESNCKVCNIFLNFAIRRKIHISVIERSIFHKRHFRWFRWWKLVFNFHTLLPCAGNVIQGTKVLPVAWIKRGTVSFYCNVIRAYASPIYTIRKVDAPSRLPSCAPRPGQSYFALI